MVSKGSDSLGSGKGTNLEIGKLPAIRIIKLSSLLLHEKPDEERWKSVAQRIARSGHLKHPPVAARDHGTATHILLDGVNRVEALRRIGAAFVLVQEVDLHDRGVILSTWHHAVEGLDGDDMIDSLSDSLRITSFEGEFTSSADFVPRFTGDCVCCIVLPDRRSYAVHAEASPENRVRVVGEVVDLIHRATNRDRVSYTNVSDLAKHYKDFSALISYKAFSKEDVVNLASKGFVFPSGVTRFSIPKRALSFDIPVAFLQERESLEAKQAVLEEMVREKIREKRIRFYAEPTFYFDD